LKRQIGSQWKGQKALRFQQKVLKMNESLTALERHEADKLMT